jgi:hypothetical protein
VTRQEKEAWWDAALVLGAIGAGVWLFTRSSKAASLGTVSGGYARTTPTTQPIHSWWTDLEDDFVGFAEGLGAPVSWFSPPDSYDEDPQNQGIVESNSSPISTPPQSDEANSSPILGPGSPTQPDSEIPPQSYDL